MTQQKVHQLLMLFLISCLVIMAALLFLEPILGVLWGLFIALFCVIFAIAKPDVWRAEKEIWAGKGRKIKSMLTGGAEETNDYTPVVYELAVIRPSGGGRYPVDRKNYLIGRGSGCSCRLSRSDTIGREHCRIVYREHSREYYIEDLRSKNGTYLGTRRLEPNTQEKLLENAEIFIGDYCLRFERKRGS